MEKVAEGLSLLYRIPKGRAEKCSIIFFILSIPSSPFFNVFRYITFRTIYAILTALLISFIIGPWLINKLRDLPDSTGDQGRCSLPAHG